MATIAEKLQMKDRQEMVVVNPPESFLPVLSDLPALTIHTHLESVNATGFVLAFVTSKAEVDRLAPLAAAKASGDAAVWFAYPKARSKRYTCDFNRDNGWDQMTAAGFETVRAIAIDPDWTALRFRRSQFIKSKSDPVS
jgi:short subunit dehydrogenase-like uncharacterized protein